MFPVPTIFVIQAIFFFIASFYVGFYPQCGGPLANLNQSVSIYEQYPDPAIDISFDTYNVINDSFIIDDPLPQIIFKFNENGTTTAFVQRKFENSNEIVNFHCTWSETFSNGQIFKTFLASSTSDVCRFDGITAEYCANDWDYGLDFCDNTSNPINLAMWSDNSLIDITAQVNAHGLFHLFLFFLNPTQLYLHK